MRMDEAERTEAFRDFRPSLQTNAEIRVGGFLTHLHTSQLSIIYVFNSENGRNIFRRNVSDLHL